MPSSPSPGGEDLAGCIGTHSLVLEPGHNPPRTSRRSGDVGRRLAHDACLPLSRDHCGQRGERHARRRVPVGRTAHAAGADGPDTPADWDNRGHTPTGRPGAGGGALPPGTACAAVASPRDARRSPLIMKGGEGPGPSPPEIRSAYFGRGGTRQKTGPDTLPDASSKKSAASPFSLIFQSMTPAPGF